MGPARPILKGCSVQSVVDEGGVTPRTPQACQSACRQEPSLRGNQASKKPAIGVKLFQPNQS